MTAEPIRYTVRMPRPHSHRLELEALFPASDGPLTVTLPVWTPGSYLVREFSRHLEQVRVERQDGAPLEVARIDKCSFRIDVQGEPVRLRYSVYANDLTVRTSHLDGSHAFFNGANVFLYDPSRARQEHRVVVEAPAGWRIFTALEQDGDAFVARDYDELVDSPFEVGPHAPLEFEAGGARHQVVIWGEPKPDGVRLVSDLRRVCETEAAMFGGLPTDLGRYVFIVHLADKGRGGLEHKASTALLYSRNALSTQRGWEDFLNLCAHEYFHLWNIKRIKPRALVPFDYAKENYTRLLWFFEGGTSYYDMLVTRRAGVVSPSRYLMRLGEALTSLHSTPGRRLQTLEEASMQAWVKHYRPDEHSPNSAISYYLKGELVAWLLDLELRRVTSDAKSLDDLMRLLWARYGDERGVPEGGIEEAVQEVAGADLKSFFDRALRSTEELDYSALQHLGLEVRFREKEASSDRGGTPARSKDSKPHGWLGANARPSGTISVVYDDSPAMNAGLYPDDEVIALDGYKVDGGSLISRIEDKSPGEVVTITAFRRDRLVELQVTVGEKPRDAAYVVKRDDATDEQKAAYAQWIGASWEDAG